MDNVEVRIVQFPHPGSEHRPDAGGVKQWNRRDRPHARKFLQQRGRYVYSLSAASLSSDLYFWAEWEPESILIREFESERPQPRYLFRPVLCPKTSYRDLHNTDPFVFGERFYYSNCKLTGQMRYLKRGSLILFGSELGGGFVLDTVFVVAGSIDRTKANYKSLPVPDEFKQATLEPLYADHSGNASVCSDECGDDEVDDAPLYFGATHSAQIEGMFSFFPCLAGDSSNGFARPMLQESQFVMPKKAMGLKIGECGIDTAREFWQALVKQMLETRAGGDTLRLGVFAEMPSRVP